MALRVCAHTDRGSSGAPMHPRRRGYVCGVCRLAVAALPTPPVPHVCVRVCVCVRARAAMGV